MMDKQGKQINSQDWDNIIQDFGISRHEKWIAQFPRLAILEQALYTIAKKEYPLKSQLLLLIEENVEVLIPDEDVEEGLRSLVEALRAVIQGPADGIIVTMLLKEQIMVATTAAMIVRDGLQRAIRQLEALVELLLGVINRPNYSVDRQMRGAACECLRELERTYPCILHTCAGHILFLCDSERTHVIQSYTLLMMAILRNLSCSMYAAPSAGKRMLTSEVSFLSTISPLVPFSVPAFLASSDSPSRELTPFALQEFRKVLGLFLARPQIFTPCGSSEFVSSLIDIIAALGLQGSLLKVQFFGLMNTYDPLLCHALLTIFSRFAESFNREEGTAVFERLVSLSNELYQPLLFRTLAIHWLLGLENVCVMKMNKSVVPPMAKCLYPSVFDPLMLKALKLDTLAYCTASMEGSGEKGIVDGSRLFKDGLVFLSAYNWLPSWSTETRLMFRMIHRFITIGEAHSKARAIDSPLFTSSSLFKTLQEALVLLAFQLRRLVPSMLGLVDRLLSCETHRSMGEFLLQMFNKDLLRKAFPDKNLPSYFPIFERIVENGSIPPGFLIDLLTIYIRNQAAEEGQTKGDELWFRGGQVLDICRTVMVHHQSSRVFHALCGLLSFLCLYYPDVEVRDNARIYLRMFISIPGKKLRAILKHGDNLNEDRAVPSISHMSSILRSSPAHRGLKESLQLISCIHLTRATPLLVKQAWSMLPQMALPGAGASASTKTSASASPEEVLTDIPHSLGEASTEPESIRILRRYFAVIPDFEKGNGIGIRVHCKINFEYDRGLETQSSPKSIIVGLSIPDTWPALFAVVLSFSTLGPYWPIRPIHIPFLLSEPANGSTEKTSSCNADGSIVAVWAGDEEKEAGEIHWDNRQIALSMKERSGGGREAGRGLPMESKGLDADMFHESFVVELSPKLPVPAIVDCRIEASDDEGRSITGEIDNVHVGLEDLFVQVLVPPDVSDDSRPVFLLDLYNSLWEACGTASGHGVKEFLVKGSAEHVAIDGNEAVKILDAPAETMVNSIERYLAPFVVSVAGAQLVSFVKESWRFQDIIWEEGETTITTITTTSTSTWATNRPAYRSIVHYLPNADESKAITIVGGHQRGGVPSGEAIQESLGSFCVLIFLPPRFHLLFKMEVSEASTRVWIRTDHLSCLLYVDEYLEALASRE